MAIFRATCLAISLSVATQVARKVASVTCPEINMSRNIFVAASVSIDDNRSRDRYNVELRFKVYYISTGQTSLLQVQ